MSMRRSKAYVQICVAAFAASLMASPLSAATPAQKPEDLVRLRDTMRCVATRAPRATSETLDSDFREQPAYARKLQRLMDTNKTCFSASTMRARGVIVPGFLAEAQLATMSGTDPVQAVAYRSALPPIAARDAAEVIALCAVRAKPAEVRALFDTAPGSAEEKASLAPVVSAVGNCTPTATQARFNRPGLRAVLALAYRRIANHNRGSAL